MGFSFDVVESLPSGRFLQAELEDLEMSPDGRKVGHPEKRAEGTPGSKDMAARVLWGPTECFEQGRESLEALGESFAVSWFFVSVFSGKTLKDYQMLSKGIKGYQRLSKFLFSSLPPIRSSVRHCLKILIGPVHLYLYTFYSIDFCIPRN